MREVTTPGAEQVVGVFERSGGSDMAYLHDHLPRFLDTYARVDRSWDRARGVQVLDIGAHWLHQSMVFRLGDYAVTAVDLPLTLELPQVRKLARAHGIDVLPVANLSEPGELETLPEGSVDLVLFTEILEHITFNPVAFWRAVYRVLKPGGRIVITTPNYYAAGSRCWSPVRFLRGFGGGISIDEVLTVNTYGHHWKEYSMREVIKYFCLLSPDFVCFKADYTDYGCEPSALGWLQRTFGRLKRGLHLEIELRHKDHGIVIEPGW